MPNDCVISRRTALSGAIAATAGLARPSAAGAAVGSTARAAAGSGRPVLAYLGSYTDASTPKGNGQGISLMRLNLSSGALEPIKVFPGASPSWITFDRRLRCLYATNEIDRFNGEDSGSVSAFRIDRDTGELASLGAVSSRGKGPTHASVHPSGSFVFVANYGSGTVAVLPVRADGGLGDAVDTQQDAGEPGAGRAAEGPPGNFSISDHDGPHAHMIAADPTGRFVVANDLGLDRTYVWRIDLATGHLAANDPAFIPAASAGAGPRHFAWHPNGRVFYNLYEEASQLAVYEWDPGTARTRLKQKLSTLPGYAGTNFTSEIVVAPSGRFLYVANRLHNAIAIFAVAADGRLSWLGEEWTRGDYPRHITLDPTGGFMVACNHRSDQATTFRVDRASGALRFTGHYTAVGSPSMLAFLA